MDAQPRPMLLEVVQPHAYPWNVPARPIGAIYEITDPAIAETLVLAGVARYAEAPAPRRGKMSRHAPAQGADGLLP